MHRRTFRRARRLQLDLNVIELLLIICIICLPVGSSLINCTSTTSFSLLIGFSFLTLSLSTFLSRGENRLGLGLVTFIMGICAFIPFVTFALHEKSAHIDRGLLGVVGTSAEFLRNRGRRQVVRIVPGQDVLPHRITYYWVMRPSTIASLLGTEASNEAITSLILALRGTVS